MNPRISYLAVGIFVTVGLVALVVLTLWFADPREERAGSVYLVRFDRDVSGLTNGSTVRYLGVEVGRVRDIRLTSAKPAEVEVELALEAEVPITRGTYATLAYQGVTGIAFINLATEAGAEEPLLAKSGQRHPVIPTRATGIAAIIDDSSDITSRLRTLLDQLTLLTDAEMRDSVTGLLANLEAITESVAEERETYAALGTELTITLERVQASADAVTRALETTSPRVGDSLTALETAAANLAELTARVDRLVARNEAAVDAFVADGAGRAPALIAEVERTLRSVQRLTDELRDDPSQFVYKPSADALELEP